VDVEELNQFLLIGALVLVLGVLAARLSSRSGLPSLLLYLLIGVVLGERFFGLKFDDAELAHSLGFAALVVILAEGGLTTRWSSMRPVLPLGVSLATVGVAVSTVSIAVFAHWLLDVSWTFAVLLGAVFSPTDAAAVFSTLRRVPLTPRVSGALEAESGLNDAPTVLLVTLVSTGAMAELGPVMFGLTVAYELVAGLVIGAAVAWLAVQLLRRVALPASGLYPLSIMAFAVLSYAGAAALHASGFAAVYVAALVLGNSDLPHRAATRSFAEGLAWLAQIGLFVMLGLLAWPGRIGGADVVAAVLVGLVVTVVARPLSVLIALSPFRTPWREQAFITVAGLRGAVPVVLATIPLANGTEGAQLLFDIVFVAVFLFTLLQAPPLPWFARWLGVRRADLTEDLEVEAAPLERLKADLLQVHVTERSRLHGVEVGELRLPPGASVALVVREDEPFVPVRTTAIRRGDDLLVVAPGRTREETEARLRAVSEGGRLAGWTTPQARARLRPFREG
jgi:cell volume regulation protein A